MLNEKKHYGNGTYSTKQRPKNFVEKFLFSEKEQQQPQLLFMEQMTKENDCLKATIKELRFEKERDLRQAELNAKQTLERRLSDQKRKLLQDVSRTFELQKSNIRRQLSDRIDALIKLKDKELAAQRHQISKLQERIAVAASISNSSSSSNSSSTTVSPKHSLSADSRDSLASCRTSISKAARADKITISRMQLNIFEKQLQNSVANNLEKSKDEQIRTLRLFHQRELQQMAKDTKKQVSLLIEELKAKERHVTKLSNSLRTTEQKLVQVSSSNQNQNTQNSQKSTLFSPNELNLTMTPGRTLGNFASRFGGSGKEKVTKEELEKEKQRFEAKTQELETKLAKSIEENEAFRKRIEELSLSVTDLESTKAQLQTAKRQLDDRLEKLSDERQNLLEQIESLQTTLENNAANFANMSACTSASDLAAADSERDSLLQEAVAELERVKQENTEFSKCIAAMKQSALEKDRRIECLQNKLKRARKFRVGGDGNIMTSSLDDETSSLVGSEMSQSTTSLDTIVEDWEEFAREEAEENYRHLTRENLELKRAYSMLNCGMNSQKKDQTGPQQPSLLPLATATHPKLAELQARQSTSSAEQFSWMQEKLRYSSLIKSLQQRVCDLEAVQENLRSELDESKEQTELLEFQLLEYESAERLERQQITSTPKYESKRCSEEQEVESPTEEDLFAFEDTAELPIDELKIRLTLLKHRKELKPSDKLLVVKAKEALESLQSQHAECSNRFMDFEMRLRETDSFLQCKIDALITEKEELQTQLGQKSEKSSPKLEKTKELNKELERCKLHICTLEKELMNANNELTRLKQECAKQSYCVGIHEEADARKKQTIHGLQRQIENITQAREAEFVVLNSKLRDYALEVDRHRRAMDDNEERLTAVLKENEQLCQLRNELQTKLSHVTKDCQELEKLVSRTKTDQLQHEKKFQEMRQKFKESLKIIKDYETTDQRYQERLHEMAAKFQQQEQRIAQIELEKLAAEKRCGTSSVLQEKFPLQVEQLQNKLDAATEEIECLQAGAARNQARSAKEAELKDEIKQLNDTCSKIKAQAEVPKALLMADSNPEAMNVLQEKLENALQFNVQLEQQFQLQINTVTFLKDQLIACQTKLKQTEAAMEVTIMDKQRVESELEAAHDRLEALNDNQKQFNNEVSSEIHGLGSTLDSLRLSVQTKEAQVAALQSHLDLAHEAIRALSPLPPNTNNNNGTRLLPLIPLSCCSSIPVTTTAADSKHVRVMENQIFLLQDELDSILTSLSGVTAEPNETSLASWSGQLTQLAEASGQLSKLFVALDDRLSDTQRKKEHAQSALSKLDQRLKHSAVDDGNSCLNTRNDLSSRISTADKDLRKLEEIRLRSQRLDALCRGLKQRLMNAGSGKQEDHEEQCSKYPRGPKPVIVATVAGSATADSPCSSGPAACVSINTLELVLAEIEKCMNMHKDTDMKKVLRELHAKVMEIGFDDDLRTHSSLEHSGTESEMHEKSPEFRRLRLPLDSNDDRNSQDDAGAASPNSSTSISDQSSLDDESPCDSNNNHTTSPFQRHSSKPTEIFSTAISQDSQTSLPQTSSAGCKPPSNLQMLGQIDDQSWLIGWSPCPSSSGAIGYKIYSGPECVQTIRDVNCSKTVISLSNPSASQNSKSHKNSCSTTNGSSLDAAALLRSISICAYYKDGGLSPRMLFPVPTCHSQLPSSLEPLTLKLIHEASDEDCSDV